MKNKVSIVMTTYNGKKYINQQIDSLLHQTRPFDELIVCDDNSVDDTYAIIKGYAEKDRRIKIFRNEKNIGFIKNFEKAILLASGDYIALCDQDDIWCENHIEILINGIGTNMLACGDAIIMSEDERSGLNLSYLMHLCDTSKDKRDLLKFVLIYQNAFLGMTMLMNRHFIRNAIPIPEHANYHDSWFAFLAIAMDSFVYIPTIITNYRLHENNVTGKYRRHPYFRSIIAHTLLGHRKSDRLNIIEEIKKRIILKEEMQKELEKIYKYYMNESSFSGRLRNLYFELKNYYKIYR